MAEHWEVDASGFNIKEEGKPITVAMTQPHSRMKQRARLIAAAPDLLEAGRDMAMAHGHPDDPDVEAWWESRAEEAAENGRDSDWYRNDALARLCAAIAKATGGAS